MELPKISTARSLPENYDLLVIAVQGSTAASPGKRTKKSAAKSRRAWSEFSAASAKLLKDLEFSDRILSALKRSSFKAGAGKRITLALEQPGVSLRLSCLPAEEKELTARRWMQLGADAYQSASAARADKVVLLLDALSAEEVNKGLSALCDGLALAAYEYTKYKRPNGRSKKRQPSFVVCSRALGGKSRTAAIKRSLLRAESTFFARDLVNTPPSDLQPRDLVAAARSIASKKGSSIAQKMFNEAQLARMGANALLAVARGSDAPPYMTQLHYRGKAAAKRKKRVVLVGKGVTYDSGGLSIKSRDGLMTMKCDMAGAACVLGVMHALSRTRSADRPVHEIHALVPTSENMINGSSVKPGDVVRAINGKTIEILNTDAEGRLLLADALSYSERLKPDIIIDVATLTGACVAALGAQIAGIFTDDDDLRQMLLDASDDAGEKVWPLPLDEVYRPAIDSKVADIKNIGSGGTPGATTAALFLKEFVPSGARWAHLDIAGPAFLDRGSDYTPAGGTGFGVRTLLNFLYAL